MCFQATLDMAGTFSRVWLAPQPRAAHGWRRATALAAGFVRSSCVHPTPPHPTPANTPHRLPHVTPSVPLLPIAPCSQVDQGGACLYGAGAQGVQGAGGECSGRDQNRRCALAALVALGRPHRPHRPHCRLPSPLPSHSCARLARASRKPITTTLTPPPPPCPRCPLTPGTSRLAVSCAVPKEEA